MKNFLAVIGGIVVGIILLFVVVFVFNDINTPGGISFSGNNTPGSYSVQKMTSAEIAQKIDKSMEATMPGAYRSELDLENELFKVEMWNSFTSDTIETLRSGLGLDRWEKVNNEVISLCDNMQSRFTDNGHPEITVVLSLVDPDDQENVFLTAARGVVGYDVVRGIDLTEDAA